MTSTKLCYDGASQYTWRCHGNFDQCNFPSLVSNKFVFFIAIEDEKVTLKFNEWIIGSFLN